jgi:hypothetical protein
MFCITAVFFAVFANAKGVVAILLDGFFCELL